AVGRGELIARAAGPFGKLRPAAEGGGAAGGPPGDLRLVVRLARVLEGAREQAERLLVVARRLGGLPFLKTSEPAALVGDRLTAAERDRHDRPCGDDPEASDAAPIRH